MKITIECNPCDIAELSKVLNTGTIDSISKENADSAVGEQNRQKFDKSDPDKIIRVICEGINKMFSRDSHESIDDIN